VSGFAYFGGIDFSGAKEPLSNLWAAVGTEHEGKLRIDALCPLPFREDLRAHVAGHWRRHAGADDGATILWGADFPFALPEAATRAIAGERAPTWAGTAAWVADRPPDEIRGQFPELGKALRRCDTGGALAPFDLRLYKQTAEGIRWLHELRDDAEVSILPQAPNPGAPTTLIEVYPSGAAKDLGIRGSRVPTRAGEIRARPAARRPFMTFGHPSLEAIACTLEDARDACIAALVAFLCRDDLDQPRRLGRVPPDVLALEGWIYRPPAAL
jgi:hypothetical protein